MWIWIIVFILFIVLSIVLEEASHYLLNQYLYESKYGKQLKWKKRMMTLLTLFKNKLQIDIHQTKKEKSS
ncbi:hypothetical protein J7E79_23160 [Bacillus sp. ISL-40]|uniref:hypothetical protein n=1 Tax=unclassified Bacillus (in: firmicutes) TaxID=185979 RepID=UPI001BECEC1B|nr:MULTISPECIES: hypothetical protein [unclassified Bacillus (in: firmicutes)]MBT2700269.1 hypothetical protein [Bacillus sp. ISL-40]MBT2724746.1 hypothetical protein [Bacillus sp. ISL-46]MBT2740142.1 hypothetical protein [Bacillus sp. ISL-77]